MALAICELSGSEVLHEQYFTVPTEVGNWQVITKDNQLVNLEFCPPKALPKRFPQGSFQRKLAEMLMAYTAGERVNFSDVPLLITTGSPFHHKVWQALREIPYGETRTYADIAEAIGSPGAFRAVGSANGRNPIPLVIPCHRVVGKDGTLKGFMRGHPEGLKIKQFLLGLEETIK